MEKWSKVKLGEIAFITSSKRIFAREENNSMLKDFLEAILNIHINKVEVKNPELTPNMADEKLGILDLKLDIDNERVVEVWSSCSGGYFTIISWNIRSTLVS